MAYEALYRRYRPSQFVDVAGQSHVVSALRNAVEADRVGHAYLFSGPRGTGKTSSARILAKALNCTNLTGGEPCDECEACQAFLAGGSYDLHELDAASNNGVEAMRDLIAKVALGSPGRTKVYILDEVHMLSAGAENALLKTLEEPPPHVVFVLCTTEPNKVVPTIRSRTQHLEFSLLTAAEIGGLIDYVIDDAGIEIDDDDRAYVIRSGGGSARDTLSALDQVISAGGAPQGGEYLDALFQALIDRDSAAALAAIEGALQSGRDAAGVATSMLADLRAVFLVTMRADVSHLPEAERTKAERRASSIPPARVTRAIEVIGTSAIEMRQAPDPRIDLEVAVIRLTRPDLDITTEALLERIEALELGGSSNVVPLVTPGLAAVPAEPASAPAVPDVAAEIARPTAQAARSSAETPAPPSPAKSGPDMVRAALAEQMNETTTTPTAGASSAPGASPPVAMPDLSAVLEAARPDTASAPKLSKTLADVRRERRAEAESEPEPVEAASAGSQPEPVEVASAGSQPEPVEVASAGSQPEVSSGSSEPVVTEPQPGLAAIQQAWQDGLLESMSGRARSRFSAGRFLETDDGEVVFGLPNPVHRDRCEEVRAEVDQALASHFGRPLALELVVDTAENEPDIFDSSPAGSADSHTAVEDEESVDLDGLVDADDQAPSGVDRVLATFEGSVVLDEHPSSPPGDVR